MFFLFFFCSFFCFLFFLLSFYRFPEDSGLFSEKVELAREIGGSTGLGPRRGVV